jgi:hypothetical protein
MLQQAKEKITAWLSPQTLFFLLVWMVLMFVGRHMLFYDPGTFWHTELGIQSIENGQIPEYDTFTFTRAGERWLTLQWAAEFMMGGSYLLGGWDLQLLITVSLLAFFFTWLLHRGLTHGLHWLPASFLVVIAIGGCSHHFHVRPHLASIFLLGWTFARLIDVEAEKVDARRLAFLIPIFAVWTNLHGGVLGGWLTVVVWWMAWITVLAFQPSVNFKPTVNFKPSEKLRSAKLWSIRNWTIVLLPLLLLGTFFLNPYGWEMPATWIEIMTLPLPGIIVEHAPTEWTKPEGMAYLAILGIYLFVFADAVRNRRSGRIVWLLPLIWAVLAYGRVRHVPLFSVTACLALVDMMPFTKLAERLERTESFFFDRVGLLPSKCQLGQWLLVPGLLIASCFALQQSDVRIPLLGATWAEPPGYKWPVETTKKLREFAAADYRRSIYNELSFGGYLAMHAPQFQTYVDDRCELFGGDFLKDYMTFQTNPAKIDDLVSEVDFALVRAGTVVDRHLQDSPIWIKIAEDDASSLYSVNQQLKLQRFHEWETNSQWISENANGTDTSYFPFAYRNPPANSRSGDN